MLYSAAKKTHSPVILFFISISLTISLISPLPISASVIILPFSSSFKAHP
jgi:hypothetical protein